MWYIVDKPVCNVMLWTGFFYEKSKISDKNLPKTIIYCCFRNFFVQKEKNFNIFYYFCG